MSFLCSFTLLHLEKGRFIVRSWEKSSFRFQAFAPLDWNDMQRERLMSPVPTFASAGPHTLYPVAAGREYPLIMPSASILQRQKLWHGRGVLFTRVGHKESWRLEKCRMQRGCFDRGTILELCSVNPINYSKSIKSILNVNGDPSLLLRFVLLCSFSRTELLLWISSF